MMAGSLFCVFHGVYIFWRRAGSREGHTKLHGKHLMEAALLLLSNVYHRGALGRSDWIHVAYVLSVPVRAPLRS